MKIDTRLAALNDHEKVNSRSFAKLLRQADDRKSLRKVDESSFHEYLKAESASNEDWAQYAEVATDVLKRSDLDHFETYLQDLQNNGFLTISILDDDYPSRLADIENLPLLLYYCGQLESLSNGIAVVGTRDVNKHRIKFTKQVAELLVEMDQTVISGLANGVDETAHETALDSGGKTAAVLPGDIETISPKSNQPIARRIPDNGVLISEVSKEIGINRRRFVERNRITSGLSKAVVITASGETGGTVHQANYAAEQGTPIFLYDPGVNDGQSPDSVKNLGAHSFSDIEELRELVNSLDDDGRVGFNRTFDSYS